ncbi:MAG TPA: thioredoxin family protein [Kiloniellales bacterium]|nr:thioredoxin family protein [Kiloniellales bacterium]
MDATVTENKLGWGAQDFALIGIDGKTHRLKDVAGPNGLVVVFMCNHCPYVRSVIGRMESEAQALRREGIGFVGINANDTETYPEDSFENMQAFAAEHGLTFPYLLDETQDVAAAYGAVCTPDFFGFDKAMKLRYRGRLDASRTTLVPNARRELYEAMSQVARTGEAPEQQHPSMGCSIKWKPGRNP